MSKGKVSFVEESLKDYAKSEQETIREMVEEFAESGVIECETQITLIQTSEIPKLKQQLKQAEVKLARAEKNYQKIRFTAIQPGTKNVLSFESFINARNLAKREVFNLETEVENIKNSIVATGAVLKDWEEVLSDLK